MRRVAPLGPRRAAPAPVCRPPLRRYASSQPEGGFFRNMLRKLNPFNAYRETKELMNSARNFAVPEMRAALEAASRIERKVGKLVEQADAREKELEQTREEFQARLQKELARLQQLTSTMV